MISKELLSKLNFIFPILCQIILLPIAKSESFETVLPCSFISPAAESYQIVPSKFCHNLTLTVPNKKQPMNTKNNLS